MNRYSFTTYQQRPILSSGRFLKVKSSYANLRADWLILGAPSNLRAGHWVCEIANATDKESTLGLVAIENIMKYYEIPA